LIPIFAVFVVADKLIVEFEWMMEAEYVGGRTERDDMTRSGVIFALPLITQDRTEHNTTQHQEEFNHLNFTPKVRGIPRL
jgi:hypothetical protein